MTEMLEYPEGTPFPGVVGRSLEDSTMAWPALPAPPPGAPNVVFIVLDDVGFGQFGCYGSDIETPNFDRLADLGLRYRSFHTTAMCSPTRAVLLTGRQQHTTGMGGIADQATGFPGFHGRVPRSCGFLSEMLVEHGYATWAVGKWHLVPREEMDLASPKHRWPLGRGFERYYGFMGAESNQWYPDLVCDNHWVEPPAMPEEGYHLSEDLTEQACQLVTDLRNVSVDKPFFLYLAYGACHAPHQAPAEWIDRYAGRFDGGWDEWRERTFRRQLELGIVPAGTELTPRPPWIPAWDSLSADEQRLAARMMEVYAGFLSHTDHQVGRVLDHLEATGDLENTIVVALSDNGASPEGGRWGSFNTNLWYNQVPESYEVSAPHIDELGGPDSYGHYPFGWAHAGNTPFQRWKRECHEGGIADPLIVAWPARITDGGAVRTQYTHAVDIVPTVLEAIGIEAPTEIGGVAQEPLAGLSLLPTFTDANAPDVHTQQYYELLGCRAMYRDGWKAVAYHAMAGQVYDGVSDPKAPFDEDRWELYHVAEDFSERHDLAEADPERLEELKALWWSEAERYGALPLHSSRAVDIPRPSINVPRPRYVYRPGAPIATSSAVDVRYRPYRITADVTIPEGGAEGVLVAHGGRFGGYSLFVQDGRLHYVHNLNALAVQWVSSEVVVPSGRVLLGMGYSPTGMLEGDVELTIDGDPVGTGHIRTVTYTYTLFGEYFCVGLDDGSPVSPSYDSPFRFTGDLHTLTVDVEGEAQLSDRVMAWQALLRSH